MKRKEVDDVLEEGGGKGMDIAEGSRISLMLGLAVEGAYTRRSVLIQSRTVQCTRDGCDNAQASFYQVQIRSADEPMTTFYKVCAPKCVWQSCKRLRMADALFRWQCTSCGQRWKEN